MATSDILQTRVQARSSDHVDGAALAAACCVAVALIAACSGRGTSGSVPCVSGATKPCACSDIASGARTSSNGSSGACSCVPVGSRGETRRHRCQPCWPFQSGVGSSVPSVSLARWCGCGHPVGPRQKAEKPRFRRAFSSARCRI
jgi:hypothetical protein